MTNPDFEQEQEDNSHVLDDFCFVNKCLETLENSLAKVSRDKSEVSLLDYHQQLLDSVLDVLEPDDWDDCTVAATVVQLVLILHIRRVQPEFYIKLQELSKLVER